MVRSGFREYIFQGQKMESGENNDVPGQSSSNSDSASDIDDEFEEFEEEEETVENDEDVVEENEVDEDRDLMGISNIEILFLWSVKVIFVSNFFI